MLPHVIYSGRYTLSACLQESVIKAAVSSLFMGLYILMDMYRANNYLDICVFCFPFINSSSIFKEDHKNQAAR